jgi:hypothetical protein
MQQSSSYSSSSHSSLSSLTYPDITYPELESFWKWVYSIYLPFCTKMFIHTSHCESCNFQWFMKLIQIYSFLLVWKSLS